MTNVAEDLSNYSNNAAAELAAQASELFTLPDIYLRLLKMVRDDNSDVNEIADLIALDVGLAARLLKMANSSFYNFPAQVDTVSRAITLIGSKELCNLVLATSVASSFKGVPTELIDMDSFWRHNVDTGLVARHLGKQAKIKDVERFFTVGLLHNIGKLLVLTQLPAAAEEIISLSRDQQPWEAEHQVLGYTYAQCGAELLRLWGLPEVLADAVYNQHLPQEAQVDVITAAILHISSRAATEMENDVKDEESINYLELIEPAAWICCGLEATDLDDAIAFAQAEAWNILGLITAANY